MAGSRRKIVSQCLQAMASGRAYSSEAVSPMTAALAGIRDPTHAKRLAQALDKKVEHAKSADEASASELETERELFRLHNSSMRLSGTMIRARVLSVSKGRLLVDTGLRVASLPASEITPECVVEPRPGPRPPGGLLPGDVLRVFLEHPETPGGGPLVSGQAAAGERRLRAVWAELEARHAAGQSVRGRVLNQLAGGWAVGVGGLVAFLPQAAATWATQQRVGELRDFRIQAMNSARRNVVLVDARRRAPAPRPKEGPRAVKREAEALKAALGMDAELPTPAPASAPGQSPQQQQESKVQA